MGADRNVEDQAAAGGDTNVGPEPLVSDSTPAPGDALYPDTNPGAPAPDPAAALDVAAQVLAEAASPEEGGGKTTMDNSLLGQLQAKYEQAEAAPAATPAGAPLIEEESNAWEAEDTGRQPMQPLDPASDTASESLRAPDDEEGRKEFTGTLSSHPVPEGLATDDDLEEPPAADQEPATLNLEKGTVNIEADSIKAPAPRPRPKGRRPPGKGHSAVASSADVEELEEVWDNFEEDEVASWSSRSYSSSGASAASAAGVGGQVAVDSGGNLLRSPTRVVPVGAKTGQVGGEARLICLTKGELNGREFSIDKRDLSVGRAADNDIVVKDPSVSRKHATIVRNEDACLLVDNRSGNGTFVNGEKIDRSRLRSGDEVTFGNIVFRFVEVGDVIKSSAPGERPAPAKPATAPGPATPMLAPAGPMRPPRMLIAVLLVFVTLMAVLMGLLINRLWGGRQDVPNPKLIEEQYLKGVTAFKAKQWDESETWFQMLAQRDPTSSLVTRYLNRIRAERGMRKSIELVREAVGRGDLVFAADQLKGMTGETLYLAEIEGLRNQLDLDIKARLEQVRRVIDGPSPAAALPQLADLRRALPSSAHRDLDLLVLEANRRVSGAPASTAGEAARPLTSSATVVATDDGGDGGADSEPDTARRGKKRGSARPSSGPARAGVERRAVDLFRAGRAEDALAALGQAGAPLGASASAAQLYREIDKFQESYKTGREDWQSKDPKAGLRSIRAALHWHDKIAGSEGVYRRELSKWLADMYFLQGIQAKAKDDRAAAFKNFAAAVEAFPEHNQSKRELQRMEEQAQKLFQDGYIIKESNPHEARAKWNEVLRLVPPGHPLYDKVKKYLEQY